MVRFTINDLRTSISLSDQSISKSHQERELNLSGYLFLREFQFYLSNILIKIFSEEKILRVFFPRMSTKLKANVIISFLRRKQLKKKRKECVTQSHDKKQTKKKSFTFCQTKKKKEKSHLRQTVGSKE